MVFRYYYMENNSCKKKDTNDLINISEVKNATINEVKDNKESKKNITSKKPIKFVENIYYFTHSC